MKTVFNNYAKTYNDIMQANIGKFGRNIDYYIQHKMEIIWRNMRSYPRTVLEYGCGTGRNIPYLTKQFPNAKFWGCDVSEKSLEIASRAISNSNPSCDFFDLRTERPLQQMDLIFVSGVFHHIPIDERLNCMIQIADFLKPKGEVFIFEHNPLNLLTRYAIKDIPFDKNIDLIYPFMMAYLLKAVNLQIIKKRYTLFFPAYLGWLRCFERLLGWLPFGGQYFFQARKFGVIC